MKVSNNIITPKMKSVKKTLNDVNKNTPSFGFMPTPNELEILKVLPQSHRLIYDNQFAKLDRTIRRSKDSNASALRDNIMLHWLLDAYDHFLNKFGCQETSKLVDNDKTLQKHLQQAFSLIFQPKTA